MGASLQTIDSVLRFAALVALANVGSVLPIALGIWLALFDRISAGRAPVARVRSMG